jgi:hypothetical protein
VRVVALLGLLSTTLAVEASRLEDAFEAASDGKQFVDLSATPAFQYAANEGESTGNYSLDAIGVVVMAQRSGGTFGNTDLVAWVNSADKIGGLDSAPELAGKAGLLWDTTDNPSDSASTSLLVLGVDQWLLDDRVSVGVGKYFPGQFYLLSPYKSDNSNTFTNKMISGNPVTSFWESIGLGVNAAYYGEGWSLQGGLVDAQASADGLDFSSFGKGNYAYALEFAYTPERTDGLTSISAMAYRVDAHDNVSSEQGVAAQFTQEFGEDAEYAAFGQYTYRNGGTARQASATSSELPVEHGGFLGFAWNRPFGRDGQQLAASAVYGEATSFKESQGFNDQFGLEAYWKFQRGDNLHITPSVQLLRNDDDEMEAVFGLRLFMGFNRGWAGSILGGTP